MWVPLFFKMKKSANLFFVLKNLYFKKIILFDRKKIYFVLFLSLISTIIFSTFPLITQVYIRHLYLQESISLLFKTTLLFILLFLIKLFIDLIIEKYKTKYFEKIEKRIKELMINKYSSKLDILAFKKSDLFTKHIHLYLKLTKTIYYNIIDFARIITVGIIIFFFDIALFMYLLYAVPIFVIFYLQIGMRMT